MEIYGWTVCKVSLSYDVSFYMAANLFLRRTTHSVPVESIERMLSNYEHYVDLNLLTRYGTELCILYTLKEENIGFINFEF